MLYKDFEIKYDELSKDYVLALNDMLLLNERFFSLSHAYDYIDSLYL